MERNLEELQVFSGRTFSLLVGTDFDGQATFLELYESNNSSYATAYLQKAQLVVNDSWTDDTSALPLEARVWFEEVARNVLVPNQ